MSISGVTHGKLRRTTAHRLCSVAMRCGNDGMFTLEAFTKSAFGTDSGRTLSGAARTLADLERDGLVRKLGKNAFGRLLFRLTPAGVAMGSADPHEVVELANKLDARSKGSAAGPPPVARSSPSSSPPPVQWCDPNGVMWTATATGLFWLDPRSGAWVLFTGR